MTAGPSLSGAVFHAISAFKRRLIFADGRVVEREFAARVATK